MHCKQSAVFGHFGFNRYICYFCHRKMSKQTDIRVLLGKRKSDLEANLLTMNVKQIRAKSLRNRRQIQNLK